MGTLGAGLRASGFSVWLWGLSTSTAEAETNEVRTDGDRSHGEVDILGP